MRKGAAIVGVLLLVTVMVPSTAKAESYSWGSSLTVPTYVYQPQHQYGNQYAYLQYLLQILEQLQKQLNDLKDDDSDDRDDDSDEDAEIEIETRSATDIEGDEARLRGEIDFNDSDDAFVWFEWGEDEDDLDEETPRIYHDEDDEEEFDARITDLDEDEEYFFRAVGEDEDGNISRGDTEDFRADEDEDDDDDDNDDDDNDEEPDVETDDANDITDDSVELGGEVDMNDFEDGKVFFVYGQDEDQVEDVESEFETYDEIDEDGTDLQKVLADSSLDNSSSYTLDIDGLDDDTEYFYNICVEYEDEDDDEVLACGSVESFETEN